MVNCSFCSSPPQTDVFIQSYKGQFTGQFDCLFFQVFFFQFCFFFFFKVEAIKKFEILHTFSVCVVAHCFFYSYLFIYGCIYASPHGRRQ